MGKSATDVTGLPPSLVPATLATRYRVTRPSLLTFRIQPLLLVFDPLFALPLSAAHRFRLASPRQQVYPSPPLSFCEGKHKTGSGIRALLSFGSSFASESAVRDVIDSLLRLRVSQLYSFSSLESDP